MNSLNIGVIGMGTMGQNLALNLVSKGWTVAVWDRYPEVLKEFSAKRVKGKAIVTCEKLDEFVNALSAPRVILMMISAGKAVDEMIDRLLPYLNKNDILIDGGNSYFEDTQRRVETLRSHGVYFVGAGISGGEEGALHGASIMPGGAVEAWPVVKPFLQSIAARSEGGKPCCEWIGPDGAGHYVKMIHNGLEYADMQLISEIHLLMSRLTDMTPEQMANVFKEWDKGALKSYLIEITADILKHKDKDGSYLLNNILDVAGQKGTGNWSVKNALNLSMPLDTVAEAVFMRDLSIGKEWRERMNLLYRPIKKVRPIYNTAELIEHLTHVFYAIRLVTYAQGFALMRKASDTYGWQLDFSTIARVWRNGCIIRSAFLDRIVRAYDVNPKLESLLLDAWMVAKIKESVVSCKWVATAAIKESIATPVISAGMNYMFACTDKTMSTNMIQAMRDYFGAHTFERTDAPRGQFFHEKWRR